MISSVVVNKPPPPANTGYPFPEEEDDMMVNKLVSGPGASKRKVPYLESDEDDDDDEDDDEEEDDEVLSIFRHGQDNDEESYEVKNIGNNTEDQVQEVISYLEEYNKCKEGLKRVSQGGKEARAPLKTKLDNTEAYVKEFFENTETPMILYMEHQFELKTRTSKNTFNRTSVKKVLQDLYGSKGQEIFDSIDDAIGTKEVSVLSRTKIKKNKRKTGKKSSSGKGWSKRKKKA